jgi:hypothetical protein
VTKLHPWGGFAEPTRIDGEIVAIHDIAEVWDHPGQEEYAEAVLVAELGQEEYDRLRAEWSSLGTSYEIFDDLRFRAEQEMRSPFWGEPEQVPEGFHEVDL